MRHYLRKLGLFLCPVLALFVTEMFVLPINAFTFRCWDALSDRDRLTGLPGQFYPNRHLTMDEYGDELRYRDPIRRKAEWFTDEYGFRNRPCAEPPERYDFVLLGDSNIAGCSHDQTETLAEVLARKGNCTAYSYGSGNGARKPYFWSEPRFKSRSPKTIVLEARTVDFYTAEMLPLMSVEPCELPRPWALPAEARVLLSRASKQAMLRFVQSRLGCASVPGNAGPPQPDLSLAERVEFMVAKVTAMRDEARRRDSDFIFLLMPSYDRTLDDGIPQLRQAGVKTIAYLPTAEHPHGVDMAWYWQHPRDSHWSKEAVVLTADEILKLSPR